MANRGVAPAAMFPRIAPSWPAALLGVGVIDLVAVATGHYRWWANFILAAGGVLIALACTASPLRSPGRCATLSVGCTVTTAGTLLTMEAMGAGWPAMITVPCLGIAVTLAWTIGEMSDPSGRAIVRTMVGLAGLGALLGVPLILIVNDVLDTGGVRWWAGFMAAAGAVQLVEGVRLVLIRRGFYWFSTAVLLLALGSMTMLCADRALRFW